MKGPQNTLFHRVRKAGLLDATMERFRAGETLAAVAAWLTDQGITADIAQTHRFKKGHYDDWTFQKAGIDIKSEDTNDINLATIKRLSVILHQECQGLSGGAETARFVQTFARFHEILMSRKADFRAENEVRRKIAMKIIDMLDSEERLAKVKDADSQAKAEGLEARIANISERIWGDVFGLGKAA